MAKLLTVDGCGPMVCSNYRELTAAIDKAYAGPRNRPLEWNGILASLADGLVRGIHPLREIADMEKELRVLAIPRRPERGTDVIPSPG
ncbi:MAG TPA: hypothetical protein VMR25_02290 [Planctomycetaceae bacterium]|jgi:hypothetical protein|nr:hypothetical protein [Planctomycetaceae bacterium]